MKVRIVQCLCPQRHCMMAVAYESETGEPDPAKTDALRTAVAEGQKTFLNPWCDICKSRDFFYEDLPTKFRTMEEARGPLAEAQRAQQESQLKPEETFRRKVTSRVALADGCEEITLECGHMSIAVGGVFGEDIWCAQCVNDYLEAHRAKKNLT